MLYSIRLPLSNFYSVIGNTAINYRHLLGIASRLQLALCCTLFIVCTDMAAADKEDLPSLYEYYTKDDIETGLSDSQSIFTLNNKQITIFSGALHYFRVPQGYWKDRLRKYRSAGLNAVETYVPWNWHEYEDGKFDFGNSTSDFTEYLDIVKFIKLAKEEDLFVILRPGPYICAEWEFGGLPSYLLRYKDIKIRTSDKLYMSFVERYFKRLLELVAPLQFTKGGAIIAVQIENEYGNTKDGDKPVDTAYLESLKDILVQNGIVELLFTSDTPSNGFSGTVPGVLATANFQEEPIYELSLLKGFQPNKPLMVMEYWTGWFDHWTEKHHTRSAEQFGQVLSEMLNFQSSVNFYMFHGGTNWGFMNGANLKGRAIDNAGYQPDITSYDYDAPLSEAGDYTDKYYKAKEIISKLNKIKVRQPSPPQLIKRVAYPSINISNELDINEIVTQSIILESENLVPMELLDINNKSGQSYGYIIYRKINVNIPKNSVLKIEGRVCDTIMVLINGKLQSKILNSQTDLDDFGYWRMKDSTLNLGSEEFDKATLELIVENWGRVNYGKLDQFNQHKGLWQGNVLINDNVLSTWQIIPLEFKKSWTNGLESWRAPTFTTGPKLYKASLKVDQPIDTYIDTRNWNKGFIIINGFVLARYCKLGPQQSVYLPGTLLKKGVNEILIFEHFEPAEKINFIEDLVFEEKL